MTGKERMLRAIRFQETDRPPHFEVMFELEREAFGLQFPDRHAWNGVSRKRKHNLIASCMDIYARIVEQYEWDALAVYWPWSDADGVTAAREAFGDRILVGTMIGHGVWAIEHVTDWEQFAVDLIQHPHRIHAEAERCCRAALDQIDRLTGAGAEFINLVHDVAFNAGPFISPGQFAEFVTPYLARLVQRIQRNKAVAMVHSDGMLMPILDQILSTGPDIIQSIDPMAGMDIAVVKKLSYGRCALMGNVQCNLLQDGPNAAIRRSALYCLRHAAPGGGYIYGTSNTIFAGMPLANYEYMLEVYRDFVHKEWKPDKRRIDRLHDNRKDKTILERRPPPLSSKRINLLTF